MTSQTQKKETQLLTSYLLTSGGRSHLTTYVTLAQFTELFPRSQRNNPQIGILYRELQHQRALITDQVGRNIVGEVKRGERQRREVVGVRRRMAREDNDDVDEREREMEIELFGRLEEDDELDGDNEGNRLRGSSSKKRHTLRSLVVEMEKACKDIEGEMGELEGEAERVLERIKDTMDKLGEVQKQRRRSDGSLQDHHDRIPIVDEVLQDLQRLEKTCDGLNRENGSSS